MDGDHIMADDSLTVKEPAKFNTKALVQNKSANYYETHHHSLVFWKTGLRWESNPGFLLLWKPANNYTIDTEWMDDHIMADESVTVKCSEITFK